jgi:NitT/TauT family transport system permease protein
MSVWWGRQRRDRLVDTLATLFVVVLVWQGLFAYAGDSAISAPWQTLVYALGLMRGTMLWEHAGATVTAFLEALAISSVLGVLTGLVLGLRRFAGDVMEPVLAGLYSVPKVTLYPMILLIFGLGMGAKVAFGVIHGVIPITLFTLNAVKTLNPGLLRTARAFRLDQMQTIRFVLAPAVLPEMVTGLRVGSSLTLLGVLIGEMFASQRGLGFLIVNLHNVRQTTSIILIVVVSAIAMNVLLLRLERWLHSRE